MSAGAPQVRITLDYMRETLVHALGQHTAEMQGALDVALKQAVESYDYASEVAMIAEQEIRGELRRAIIDAIREPLVQKALYAALSKRTGKRR